MTRASPSDAENKVPDDLLEESPDFRLLFDCHPQPMWIQDRDSHRFLAVNDAAVRHYGYSRSEFLAMTIADIRSPDDHGAVVELVSKSPDDLRRSGVWKHQLKDGRQMLADITWHSITFEGRRAELAMVNDITTRILAEETIERYGQFHERQQEALTRLMQSATLHTGEVTPALQEITEAVARAMVVERVSVWRFIVDRSAIKCDSLFELTSKQHSSGGLLQRADYPGYFQALHHRRIISAADAANDPRTSEFTESYMKPLGITSMLDAPIFVNGQLEGVLCIESTRRRRIWTEAEQSFALSVANLVSLTIAQQARAQSEARARTIVETEPECVKIVSPDGRLLEMNPAGLRILEAESPADVLGLPVEDFVHQEDRHSFMALHRMVCGGKTGMLQFRFVGLKGTERWIEIHSAPLRDGEGNIIGALSVARDISQHQRVLMRLRHREAMLRIAGKVGRMGAWAIDADERLLYWSQEACELFGYPPDVIPGREQIMSLLTPASRESFLAAVDHCLETGEPVDLQVKASTRTGKLMHTRCLGECQRDSTGRIIRVHGAIKDITERVLTEMALRENEERLRYVTQATVDAIWDWNLLSNEVKWNSTFFTLFGYDPEKVPSDSTSWTSRIHPEDLDETLRDIHAVIDGEEDFWEHTYRFQRADGSYAHVIDRGFVIRDDSGLAIRMVGGMTDITEQRLADRALQQREALLRIAGKLARMGGWAVTIPDHQVFWSDEMYEILGFPVGEMPPPEISLSLYTPESLERLVAVIDRCTETGESFDEEVQIYNTSGKLLNVRISGEAELNDAGKVVRFHGAFQDITEQRRVEMERKRLADRLTATLENMSDAFLFLDNQWNIAFMNEEASRVLCRKQEELIDRNIWDCFPEAIGSIFHEKYHEAVHTGKSVKFQSFYDPLDEWFEVSAYPSENGLAIYFRVITSQLAFEEHLKQSQRIEAVGKLTGGVAHDFNNLLTVIMGNAELLVEELADNEEARQLAETILQAGNSGADLTHRLLAFARKQALDPKPVDVGALLLRMDPLLKRTLGEDVEIEFVREAGLWRAMVDPAQLESAVLNLCINARDAMPNGGKLTIETQSVVIDADYAEHHTDVQPGQYVMVAISDTGEGIAPEHFQKVFDPFFTTKEPGKGTGLGLSMVHGFVKQSSGHIKIYSELGEGTTVKMYLPRLVGDEEPIDLGRISETLPGGTETVLLVEDDELVRIFALNQLRVLGYKVLETSNGPAALELLREHDEIDLLFTDIVMPGGMNGRQLADAARGTRPDLKVLYTSGYTDNAIVHHGRLDPGAHLLGKPYSRLQLACKIREVLDEKA
jgi:PAS domain S-box-containing protein